ncbi:MAG: hypothetical protein J6X33_08610 [Clostridiales bacterium]|nr:hypothetical protein [Clostridiales bacterium]
MRKTNKRHNGLRISPRGSSSLEGAISFSAVLVFIVVMINILAFVRADIMMQRSCEQTAERLAAALPAMTSAGDVVSTVANAVPSADKKTDAGDKAVKAMAALSKLGIAADDMTGGSIRELVLEGVLAKKAASDIAACYKVRNNGSELMMPDYINILFDIDDDHNIIYMTAEYKIPTILGDVGRSVETAIPVYGSFSLFLNGSGSSSDEEDDIWSRDQMDRGDEFRGMYNANLPKMFPVADRYENGNVTSIRSIDLTAPDYTSGNGLKKTIKYDINRLAKFSGDKMNYKGTDYVVKDIRSKTLLVVIPSNSDPSVKATLAGLSDYARSRGVKLDITEYGISRKYEANAQD